MARSVHPSPAGVAPPAGSPVEPSDPTHVESLVESGVDVSRAGPRLRASWERSYRYGASLDEVAPVFTGSVDTGSLLYECGHQVLQGLQATLANEPVSLMLADSSGLVLARLCNDRVINRSLDRVHLAPGFWFTERNAGTNGLGLSLADRAPTLVRAEQHYCTALRGYTCAAVPVIDPLTGELAGSVNLTTWSDQSSELLLALAQAAAGNTAALMMVRASGRSVRAAPRGEVFHVSPVGSVQSGRSDLGVDPCGSAVWREAVSEARAATESGRVLAVVGEPGAGKTALATLARRGSARHERMIEARTPAADEVWSWLELWTPELEVGDVCVIVSGVESLPAWAADDLARRFAASTRLGRPQPYVVTARDYSSIPLALAGLVDTVVEAPPLRERPDDVLPLARFFARQERHRDLTFTPRATRALTSFAWPENVGQLRRVVRDAAARADVIDARHLPAEVFTGGTHALSRLETVERDEIVRALTEPGTTVARAAATLGMGRATIYRKMAQYGIRLPDRRG